MESATLASLAFIFYLIVRPEFVKNRLQFNAAMAAQIVALLVQALSWFNILGGPLRVLAALIQIGAVVLLILAAGGFSLDQFTGELRSYQIQRRGDDKPTTIIPPPGMPPGSAKQDADEHKPYVINEEGGWEKKPTAPATPPPTKPETGPLPLE